MLKVLGWTAYAAVALIVSFFALDHDAWFGLAVALCFIFGPRVWKSM